MSNLHNLRSIRIVCFLVVVGSLATPAAHGIERYQKGDELYVWANSGLRLREEPDADSRTLAIIPYGSMVIPQSDKGSDSREMILIPSFDIPGEGRSPSLKAPGDWVLVKHGTTTGFLFDAFLSKLPPIADSPEGRESFEEYAERAFGVLKVLVDIEKQESEYRHRRVVYQNGMIFDKEVGFAWYKTSYVLPGISLAEGYLLYSRLTRHDGFLKMEMAQGDGHMIYHRVLRKTERSVELGLEMGSTSIFQLSNMVAITLSESN